MALKNLYDSKPIKIHIFGEPAEGELKRPFKAAGLFGECPPFNRITGREILNPLQELAVTQRQTRRPSTRPRSESEPRRRNDFLVRVPILS